MFEPFEVGMFEWHVPTVQECWRVAGVCQWSVSGEVRKHSAASRRIDVVNRFMWHRRGSSGPLSLNNREGSVDSLIGTTTWATGGDIRDSIASLLDQPFEFYPSRPVHYVSKTVWDAGIAQGYLAPNEHGEMTLTKKWGDAFTELMKASLDAWDEA